jgi:transketolase
VKLTKQNLGWPLEPPFLVPDQAAQHFGSAQERGALAEAEWNVRFAAYAAEFPPLADECMRTIKGALPSGWDKDIPVFPADAKGMATRTASGKVMNTVAPRLPTLIGGSADLDPSTFTALTGQGDFEPTPETDGAAGTDSPVQGAAGGVWGYAGRNVHFGVREHAMGAVANGMAAHGGVIPFGSTFLIFSDYMRPPMRLAALMGLHVVYVFTHDSIAVGEDGETHQPIEQLAGLRAVPRLTVIRPCDANETAVAWKVALESADRPVALILTRQEVPTLARPQFAGADGLRQGAYVLTDSADGKPDLILIASGSEVTLAVEAAGKLQDVKVRIVSMPSWELFDAQPADYRNAVLPPSVKARLAIEMGVSQGWHRYVGDSGDVLGIERYGASAPGSVLLREFGFTADNVCAKARAVLEKIKQG